MPHLTRLRVASSFPAKAVIQELQDRQQLPWTPPPLG